MSDSGSGIGKITEEMGEAAGEVVQDFGKDMGQVAAEVGQAVTGQQPSPQQIQQQQQQDQIKIAEQRRKLKWFRDLAESQKIAREKETQKLIQHQQAEQAEAEQKEDKIVVSQAAVPQGKVIREDIAETMPELKGGRGKGG